MTATIKVPDFGVPIVKEGLKIPVHNGNDLEYAVTDGQANKWNNLTKGQQLELVKKSSKEKKDLRDYL